VLFFRGLLVSSPTSWYFQITNLLISLNPLLICSFLQLLFISASFMTSLLFVFQYVLNLAFTQEQKLEKISHPQTYLYEEINGN